MCVTEKDIYHGSVLAKISCGNPEALRMIERRKNERAVYQIDGLPDHQDPAYFYLKHSSTPRRTKKTNGHYWNFSFSENHIQLLRELLEREGEVHVTLVCGRPDIKGGTPPIQICLLFENELRELLNLDTFGPGNIRVEHQPAKQLRAFGSRNPEKGMNIPANRLDRMTLGFDAA